MSIRLIVQNPRNLRTAMKAFRTVLPVELDKDITPIYRLNMVKQLINDVTHVDRRDDDQYIVWETSRMVFVVEPYTENGRDVDHVNNAVSDPATGIFQEGHVEMHTAIAILPPMSTTLHIIEERGCATVDYSTPNDVAQNEYDNPWNCHLRYYDAESGKAGHYFSLMTDMEYNKCHPVGIAFEKAAKYILDRESDRNIAKFEATAEAKDEDDAQERPSPTPKRMKTRRTQ